MREPKDKIDRFALDAKYMINLKHRTHPPNRHLSVYAPIFAEETVVLRNLTRMFFYGTLASSAAFAFKKNNDIK